MIEIVVFGISVIGGLVITIALMRLSFYIGQKMSNKNTKK